ncbi:MAG: hypothetical protein RKO66_01050 [Candidatus Contendobacter sp.]|nr:hypothetical protein [Candidatus Contendobacter sp.]MDS4060313.1 hypothetical protein [Candidatus Contendobacter sp.]
MNDIYSKKCFIIILLMGLLVTLLIIGGLIRPVHAQTNLQELNNRVVELEKRLADARARQEKAYSIQMKLDEQERKLSDLTNSSNSEEYKIQIIEIRANIKNIRTKIEAITKEKNDLEENLRLARNLQAILIEGQTIAKPDTKTQAPPVQESKFNQTESRAIPSAKPITIDTGSKGGWRMESIRISNHFNDDERNEIMKNFNSGTLFSQDDLLNSAYQTYSLAGVSLRLIVHPRNGNTADLEITLGQRDNRNRNSGGTSFVPMTLDQFKNELFKITVDK